MAAVKYAKNIKRRLMQNLINVPGWTTDRKLVVIESDDWGSIRMPSREVYEKLLKSGYRVQEDPFTRYDSLESEEDLTGLMETLAEFRDAQGRNPVITANCAVANPDFAKIEASGFQEYYYEPFTETLKTYPQHRKTFELWQQAIADKLFFPQLHCREHLNVARWMRHLKMGRGDVRAAFANRMISLGDSYDTANKYVYMDAYNYDTPEEFAALKQILLEGQALFTQIFGFFSKSFIAACYIWSSDLEAELAKNGIEYIQGGDQQLIPRKSEGTHSLGRKRHFLGQVNRHQQIYLTRNCHFEPSWEPNFDPVDNCLAEIAAAFKWRKPATISTHRLNYIGCIDENNRAKNLRLFSFLLSEIIKNWPELEFITSVELGDLIRSGIDAKNEH